MAVTISTHNGTAAHRGHNIRDERAIKNQKHIDRNGIYEIWKDETERNAYKRLFGEAQEEYNARQTRSDRIIRDYYRTVENDAKKHTSYEMIVSIGNSKGETVDDVTGKEILSKFVDGWSERNPNLELIGAYYHADEEGVPHVHCDYIPVAHGYKRGMKTQNGLVKALGEMGFEKHGKATAQIQWQARENKHLEELCLEHGIEVVHPTKEEIKHLDTEKYKAVKDNEYLKKRLDVRKEELDTVKSEIRSAKKHSKTLQNENDELEAENGALNKENAVLGQNMERMRQDLERVTEKAKEEKAKTAKYAKDFYLYAKAIPVKQQELQELTAQVETEKESQEQLKTQVAVLCNKISELEDEYEEKEKRLREKAERELKKAEEELQRFELQKEKALADAERLAVLQELSQQLNSDTKPKMSKQLVGSGTIVQASPERIEMAFEALYAMKALDLMAIKNKRRETQLIELRKKQEEEYQEKLVTTRHDARREVAQERVNERNQFRKEKKELENRLKNAEYKGKMVDKYMQQTGQTAKFEEWKMEQAKRTVRNSIKNLEEVSGFEHRKDYGLER